MLNETRPSSLGTGLQVTSRPVRRDNREADIVATGLKIKNISISVAVRRYLRWEQRLPSVGVRAPRPRARPSPWIPTGALLGPLPEGVPPK